LSKLRVNFEPYLRVVCTVHCAEFGQLSFSLHIESIRVFVEQLCLDT